MKFEEMGYPTADAYFADFFATLLKTNRSQGFYVDWKKIYLNIKKHVDEISLLNGLVNIKEREERRRHMAKILEKYPSTRLILPLVIAVRDDRLDILKIDADGKITYNDIDFANSQIDRVLEFCDETGIVDLFGEIKDLHSYLTGVEVGCDTNARKNRSGTAFENMVLEALGKKGIDVRKPKKKIDLGRSKKSDLEIYDNGKLSAIVEVNFFNDQGSKPLETIQSYITLQNAAREKNIRLILITDGPAWKIGQNERMRAFEQLDYPMNFAIALKLIPEMVKKWK